MRDYIIATDSCCDFDENLIRELDLTVIPLSVHLGQDHFRNYPGEMPESHVFYTRLSKGEPAQTSAPNVEAFKDAFRPFLEAGKDVLYLGFSSALSATYQNAAMAVEELREAFPDAVIRAVDTLCASMGQGLLVDLAVRKSGRGSLWKRWYPLSGRPSPTSATGLPWGISASCAGVGGCLPAKPLWGTC